MPSCDLTSQVICHKKLEAKPRKMWLNDDEKATKSDEKPGIGCAIVCNLFYGDSAEANRQSNRQIACFPYR
jgi:hypothetical protein